MIKRRHGRKAVAPVLATLLMIAVAVAMSVIIFMWSQGFLSNTSGAVGGQQGAQNQAAQSSIALEDVLFSAAADTATVYIRNVGSVSVTLGTATATGLAQNSGFSVSTSTTPPTASVGKGSSQTLIYSGMTGLVSGDSVTFKITTTVGTFASGTFTVP